MENYKILVVDDDYASRLMLKKALEQEQYNVTLCSNGNDALNLLKEEKFDLSDFENMANAISLPHLDRLKADYQRLGPDGVAICTARPHSDKVVEFMAANGYSAKVKMLGIPDRIVEHGSLKELYQECHYDAAAIVSATRDIMHDKVVVNVNG